MNTEKSITVIIVTYNRPKDLKDAVDSVLGQSVSPDEIIVVDDGSRPAVSFECDDKRLNLVRFEREVGLSNARNYGVEIAKGEYVVFIDDDALADRCWLEEMHAGIRKGADILGGPLEPIYESEPPKWWDEKEFGGYVSVGNIRSGEIWGANFAIRKEVLVGKLGYFKSQLGRQKGKLLSGDEAYLVDRGKRLGCSVLFVPKAVVFHKVKSERMTLRYILRWHYYWGKTVRIWFGYRPLRICFFMLKNLLEMSNLCIMFSGKSVRIKKIARMVELYGRLV